MYSLKYVFNVSIKLRIMFEKPLLIEIDNESE